MTYSRIIGTGSYLPTEVLTNFDFEKIVDTSDEWIVTRTGVKERHICRDQESVITMGEQASRHAIEMANISNDEIDLIIVATSTPENFFPSTACSLQHRLNIGPCIAFDMSAACSGFVYALTVADQFIRTGTIKTALVIGSEAMTRAVDWQDRNTCVLFGDGAGAVILKKSDEPGIIASKLYCDGQYAGLLSLPTGMGIQADIDQERECSCCGQCGKTVLDKILNPSPRQKSVVNMKGRELFKIAIEAMSSSIKELLSSQNMGIEALDWVIPHQANLRIINMVFERINLPLEKVILTLENQANTSGASIPLALDCAVRDHRIKKGQTLLFEAFGGGLTWGSVLLKY